jgi:predicted nucleic acid-binding protein
MIIGDSSALVALSIMDRLDLLETIFGKIYVPQAVYDEVTISHKPQSLKLKNFLKDKISTVDLTITQMGLGQGELEVIALYKHLGSDFLLIDDRRAKKFAQLNSVNVIGSLGVMILAKEQGLIDSIRNDLQKLIGSDVFISKSLIDKVLLSVGE